MPNWEILKTSRSETRQEVDSKQDSKIAVIKRRYPDNKYDLAVENIGTVGVALKRRPTQNPKDIYSIGDSVIIDFPAGKMAYSQIRCKAVVSIPAEEEYIFGIVNDYIYLSRYGSKGISIYTIEGEYQEFIAGYLGDYFPQGMASSSDYIFKNSGYTISKFSKSNKIELTSWTGNLNNSRGICVSGNYIYVANYGAHNILKYDFSGNLITSWGSYGTGDRQFDNPWGICGDNDGNILVTDRDNSRVQKFNSSGGFLNKFSVISSPYDIAIDNTGYIYISKSSAIYKYNSSGDLITSWSITDTWPFYMKFEEDILYVSGANSKKIYKYTADGVLSDSWSTTSVVKGIAL